MSNDLKEILEEVQQQEYENNYGQDEKFVEERKKIQELQKTNKYYKHTNEWQKWDAEGQGGTGPYGHEWFDDFGDSEERINLHITAQFLYDNCTEMLSHDKIAMDAIEKTLKLAQKYIDSIENIK